MSDANDNQRPQRRRLAWPDVDGLAAVTVLILGPVVLALVCAGTWPS